MVYKKYIVRNGKTFGPYYYKSIKKDGKVITQYIKNPEDFPKKKLLPGIKKNFNKFRVFSIIFLILILGFFILKPIFTGKVIMSIDNAGVLGETLSGNLALNLEPNEFIPASTKVLIENNGEKYEFLLSNLIKESPDSREFYVSGADISGFGEGYGVKEKDLEVSFTMNILAEPKKIEDNAETNENNSAANEEVQAEIINETEITEIQEPSETIVENEITEETTESNETATESEITGSIIKRVFSKFYLAITGKTSLENIDEVSAKVSKDKPFVYALEEGQTAEIINSDKNVNLEIINNSAVITTDYSGEGAEYLINLSELNISVRDKTLEIKLIYNETEFYYKNFNLGILKGTVSVQNISEINLTIDNSTIQYGAVLGEPVKWKKKITASEQNTIIELPKQAENISVYKIENQNVLLNSENLNSLTTGNLILEYKSPKNNLFSKLAKFITGRAIEVTEKTEKIEVNISENGSEYEVVYETPGPVSFEKNTSSGKEVIISSEVHYENVLAYTELPENTNLGEIKLYHVLDGSKTSVDFIAYNKNNEIVEESNDLDDDILGEIEKIINKTDDAAENTLKGINKSLIYGKESSDKLDYSVKKIRADTQKGNLVSRIEWIVPSLSNQSYEIILISKAEHLDSNKNFISDIYEQVKSLDGNWSEQINDSEYVRVTFEKNLTKDNDITIYPRTINGTPRVEVYENNKTELIAEFTNITDNEYNKVYLTNLNNSQNIFELKILGGSVEFDHIIDPIILGNANSVNTNTTYENNFTHLNVSNSSIVAYYPFDDNVSATTVYDYTDNSNDGTVTNGAVYNSSGVYGGAYTFDGVNDYVEKNGAVITGTPVTFSAWVKTNSSAMMRVVVINKGGTASNVLSLYVSTFAGVQHFDTISSTVASTTNVIDGKWHNIVGVFVSNSNRSIFVDGVLEGTNTDVRNAMSGLNLTTIGSLSYSTGRIQFFNGSIDEVMIWNRALNSIEVLAIYNNQTNRFFGTGEMNYTNVNFGGNDTINITLAGCQQKMGSYLRAKVNNGAYVNFSSSCSITDYNATGNLNSANVTVGFVSDANRFYTPLVIGNISLEPRDTISPVPVFANPTTNASNLSQNFIQANVSVTEINLNTINISLFNSTQNIINSTTGTTSPVYINFSGLSDGTYYLNATISDTAGNKNQTETRKIGLDTTFPTITINLPLNNSFSSQANLSINFTVQDSNLNTCWYSNDSYTANTTLTNCNTNITMVQWVEGQHNVTIWVNDTANNVNSSRVSFTIDTTFPTFSWIDPTPADGTKTTSTSIYLNTTITDATQTAAWFDWNKSLVGYWSMDVRNSTGVFDNSTYKNFVTQSGGAVYNSSGVYGGAYTFDGVNDYVEKNGAVITGTPGTFSAWVKTNSSAMMRVVVINKGGTASNVLSLYVSTFAGVQHFDTISSTVASTTNVIDGKWHNIVGVFVSNSNRSIFVDGVLEGTNTDVRNAMSGLTLTTIGSLSYLGGRIQFFNGSIDEVMVFNRALSSTEISALYNNTANRLQNNFTSLSDAVYNYSAYSIDKAGNLNITSPNRQVTVDTIFPTISINIPVNNTFISNDYQDINFTVQDSNLNTCWYQYDDYSGYSLNTTLANCNTNITNLIWSGGPHNATIWVNDSANNVNSSRVDFTIDTTFPIWTNNKTNLTQSTLNGKGVYFNITLTDVNPDRYIFSWYNGTAWENTTAIYTNNQEVSLTKTINVDIATINWTWYINDSANNLNQTTIWSVTLLADDNVPPNISFANPTTNASNLSQNFIYANLSFADATSSISMANISLFNSTQNIINSTQGTTSTLEINFTGLADGTYYLNASVNDTLGNRNQTETRRIVLDRVAPNLTINSPSATTYTTSTILFNVTAIDLTTLVDSCWYTINSGTTNQTLSKDGTTNFYNFTQTPITDSSYTARFYCNDSANNVNNTQNVAFTIDTSVPAVAQGGGVKTTGGVGGGTSKPEKKRIFNLGYNMYDQTISLNQVEFDKLQIINNGEVADDYIIEIKTIDNIISFDKKELHLEPGESQAPEFKISSPKEPGIYTGKIIVSNGVSEREVLVTINVKTEKSLFDITLTIPESLKTLLVGQNLVSKIDLIQMGLKEKMDVTLNYVIKDFDGQTYLSESETIAVFDQKSYEKEFFTGELSPGQYVLGTELIHPDGVAVASTHFVVQERGIKFGKEEILLTALISVLILISLIIFLSIRKYKKVGKLLRAKNK